MSDAWRRIDLEGGGLQSANLRLAGVLKRRTRAYALWVGFPLGLHRSYLDEPRGAWGYRLLTLAFIAMLFWDWRAAMVSGALLLGLALFDLFWIDRRVTARNKALRKAVYLSQGPGAPVGYRGRYSDDAGPPPSPARPEGSGRAPSFAEQERLLRELAARRGKPRDGDR